MAQVHSVADAERLLYPYVQRANEAMVASTRLERSSELAALVGNPEKKLRVVHIAGTSGKTSTSYYCAALLRATGKKIGLTVSPHVDSITERVQINGEPLSDVTFCTYFNEFFTIINRSDLKPSYFDFMMVFALWVFAKEDVDYAVVETGLGGLLDTSNIVTRSDKVCVITDIGLDHVAILGDTIEEIALQKAGIIHSGNVTLMNSQPSNVVDVIESYAKKVGGEVMIAENNKIVPPDDTPLFQVRNWSLAYAAIQYVINRDNLKPLAAESLLETYRVHVPGRMDVLHINGTTIVLDGAHNEQKMSTLIESFKDKYPYKRPVVVFAQRLHKDTEATIPQLASIASRMIVTKFSDVQDTPVSALDPNEIASMYETLTGNQSEVIDNPCEAIQTLINKNEPLVLVTGSFFLVAEMRRYLRKISTL